MTRVLLVSMPWRRSTLPAIGLSLLKAGLARAGFACDVEYFNLLWQEMVEGRLRPFAARQGLAPHELTEALYALAGYAEAGDFLFADELHTRDPSVVARFEENFRSVRSPREEARCAELFLELRELVSPFLDACLARRDWSRYAVVGISSVLYQQLPSLALARRLKERFPHLVIAMGGPLWEGRMGRALVKHYRFVDYAFSGEADRSFVEFVAHLDAGQPLSSVPGVCSAESCGEPAQLITNVDELPYPDYDDFYAQYEAAAIFRDTRLTLPVEAARGCWWGEKHHCIFCGLNGEAMGFRVKSPDRILAELEHLDRRYRPSRIGFTDNILSRGYWKTVFPSLRARTPHTTYFAEVKSNMTRADLQVLRRAGFRNVQPGIESLSTPVLEEMRKGVTALANVACLRHCREVGINASWNLLYGFPNETQASYAANLEVLRRITHLDRPSSITRMRLVRFSPSYEDSAELGFHAVRPSSYYSAIYPFPREVMDEIALSFDFDYDPPRDPEMWIRPIREFVTEWAAAEERGCGHLVYEPLPNGAAVIHDSRFNRTADRHELDPLARAVYEACESVRSLAGVTRRVAEQLEQEPAEGEVQACLDRLHDDLVLVREGDRHLAVAMTSSDVIPWLAMAALSQALGTSRSAS